MHFRYPLEAIARQRDSPRQDEFVQRARQSLRDTDDVRFEAAQHGLKILAAGEDSLANVAEVLRTLYGDGVEMHPPTVRLMPGNPVRQPVASVSVSARRAFGDEVRAELARRGARIIEESTRPRFFIVRSEAPLASLLGFPRQLGELTGGTAIHWIRLSHYAPLAGA